MTPSFAVCTTLHFDRLLRTLHRRHADLAAVYAEAIPVRSRFSSDDMLVQAKGCSPLGTQLYLHDAPENGCDFLSRQLDPAGRTPLTLPLRPTESQHPWRASRSSARAETAPAWRTVAATPALLLRLLIQRQHALRIVLQVADARLVGRMCRQPLRRLPAAVGRHLLPQRHGGPRVVASARREFDTDAVGLLLLLPTVGQHEHHLREGVTQLADFNTGEVLQHGRANRRTDGGRLLPSHPLTHVFA